MSILLYSMRLFHRRYRGDVSLLAMLSCKCTSLHLGTHILQKQYISILMYRCIGVILWNANSIVTCCRYIFAKITLNTYVFISSYILHTFTYIVSGSLIY